VEQPVQPVLLEQVEVAEQAVLLEQQVLLELQALRELQVLVEQAEQPERLEQQVMTVQTQVDGGLIIVRLHILHQVSVNSN